MNVQRLDIQALRGVAVLLVVAYHAGVPGLTAGYLGVDLFFVLSGFLITGLIKRGLEEGNFSFAEFYYRRAKRLLPAAYVVLALVVICAPFLLTEIELDDLRAQVIGSIAFVANFVLLNQTGYFDGAAELKPLLHFWSLAVEEQYYFVMPIFLMIVPRKKWIATVAAIVAASFCLSMYIAPRYPDFAFYLPFTRIWELGIGSLGALAGHHIVGRRWLHLARLPAILVVFFVPFFPTGLYHPGIDALMVCVSTLIIILGRNGSPWETARPIKALARIGDISYSLYLIHWPVLVFVRSTYLGEPPDQAIVIAIMSSLALSILLHRFVEEPIRQNQRIYSRRFALGALAASLTLIATPIVLKDVSKNDLNYTQVLRRNYGLDVICAEGGRVFNRAQHECQTGPAPKVIVWGDSFAMMWVKAIADDLTPLGINLVQATMPRCTPLADAAISAVRATIDRREYDLSCLRFNESVMKHIMADPSLRAVVIASPFATPVSRSAVLLRNEPKGLTETNLTEDISISAIRDAIDRIRAVGLKVLVLAPPPMIGLDGGACQERKRTGKIILGKNLDCVINEAEWRTLRAKTLAWIDRLESETDVTILWPSDVLCADGSCATAINGAIVYRDAGHLTFDGSAILAEKLKISDVLYSMTSKSQ